SKIAFVPHIIVGLHWGKLKGEFKALEMISKYKPNSLVVIALIPLKGTPLGSCSPPTPEDIAQVLAASKLALPTVPVTLGCMRPLGEHRVKTDIFAVKAGVNAIAFPEKAAIDFAKELGLNVTFSPLCCSQIYEDIVDTVL
ncbi:radical SAM protein, partial [Candidatus Bathyarchaeota archaeon]|nr:radical SAM protein [Candidatus Bathyarchaeota archaeon]